MRSIVVRVLAAVLLFAAAWACWTTGRLEARVADADRQLAMLRYEGPLSEYDDIEQTLGYVDRLPAIPLDLRDDLREGRATAQYWDAAYDALSMQRDAAGQLVEKDPNILFMGANAAYRASQRRAFDRTAAARALDGVVLSYVDVLKTAPEHIDAAYNYEYAVRMRDVAARDKTPLRTKQAAAPAPGAEATVAQDLPSGPTLHGRPGGPPAKADMKEFKMMIPLEGEERSEEATAPGKGQRRVRKG